MEMDIIVMEMEMEMVTVTDIQTPANLILVNQFRILVIRATLVTAVVLVQTKVNDVSLYPFTLIDLLHKSSLALVTALVEVNELVLLQEI